MSQDRSAYDAKLESILRTSAQIFAEKGYHQASIRDISRATGISLSGLYYYFDSKEELLFLIQDFCFQTLIDNLGKILEDAEEPPRRLRLLIENHLRFFVNNMAEMKVLSHEADSLSGEYRSRVNAKKRQLTQVAAGILADLNPHAELDPRVAIFSLFGMMNWLYNWYRPGRDAPVERLAEDMSRLFLRGFLQGTEAVPQSATEGAPGDARPSIWGTNS